MTFWKRLLLAVLVAVPGASAHAQASSVPNPVLKFVGSELYTAGGKNWIRYKYDVLNKSAYPEELFAAAPALPPCGKNANSSRSWVDFFAADGKRIYGFCALAKPDNLGSIWFAAEEKTPPPRNVYIEIKDRQADKIFRSNLAGTEFFPDPGK